MNTVTPSPAVGVDVLKLLDESIAIQHANPPSPLGGIREHPVRFYDRMAELKTARDAIAELIAADVELDEANEALRKAVCGCRKKARISAERGRQIVAIARRSAALAAIRSGGGLV